MGHETAELTRFLIHHGYSVIFFWVLAEQAGIPYAVTEGDDGPHPAEPG